MQDDEELDEIEDAWHQRDMIECAETVICFDIYDGEQIVIQSYDDNADYLEEECKAQIILPRDSAMELVKIILGLIT